MRSASLLFILTCVCNVLSAQSQYAVQSVPQDLKTRASAVIRYDETSVEIKKPDDVIIKVRKAVTILNENGNDAAGMVIWYDKTRQIKSLKATIYNEFGLVSNKITEKNFRDESAISDFSLFEDTRIKRYLPAISSYPYTIEYEYEIRVRQTLVLPEWNPVNSTDTSIESSVFMISCPPGFHLRYKEFNNPGQMAVSTNEQGYKTYKWEISNIRAIRTEPFSPDPESYLPSVKLAPSDFNYQDINGVFKDWKEYGLWMNEKMLQGKDALPAETVDYIKNLIENIDDPKQKAQKIYEYVQKKTRYVSVQIGIGGFQPMPAGEVDRLSYGDCKALTNYMMALLKAGGIKSYYAVIQAGNLKKDAIPDFASMNQFNHVILCIPFANDTTWVDCTSKTLPFGYLGNFTDDRLAVICTEDGGKLIRTPGFKAEENKQVRKAEFIIDGDGGIKGNMVTAFEGSQYGNREVLIGEPYPEQLKRLKSIYRIDLDVTSFSIQQKKDSKPVTTEQIEFHSLHYGSVSGDRLFIPLNIIDPIGNPPRELSSRVTCIYINRGYTDKDEIIFTLPEGYKLDMKPADISVEKPFGKFTSTLEIKENKAIYTRHIQLYEGLYPSDQYAELVSFYQKIADSDQSRITMIR